MQQYREHRGSGSRVAEILCIIGVLIVLALISLSHRVSIPSQSVVGMQEVNFLQQYPRPAVVHNLPGGDAEYIYTWSTRPGFAAAEVVIVSVHDGRVISVVRK